MQYILARYTGDSAFDIVMDGVTVLMYIALAAIIALLVVYACTPVKWKKRTDYCIFLYTLPRLCM